MSAFYNLTKCLNCGHEEFNLIRRVKKIDARSLAETQILICKSCGFIHEFVAAADPKKVLKKN